jgi:F-type H+-transporting ATPase subunit beta
MPVFETGATLQIAVGGALVGRMLDIFGETTDGAGSIEDCALWPIHRPLLPLADRSTGKETFTTGIKAIDLLAPLERGGKSGLFGGAGVGKTVLINELIHSVHRHRARLPQRLVLDQPRERS